MQPINPALSQKAFVPCSKIPPAAQLTRHPPHMCIPCLCCCLLIQQIQPLNPALSSQHPCNLPCVALPTQQLTEQLIACVLCCYQLKHPKPTIPPPHPGKHPCTLPRFTHPAAPRMCTPCLCCSMRTFRLLLLPPPQPLLLPQGHRQDQTRPCAPTQ
jgi:hypothetical protein